MVERLLCSRLGWSLIDKDDARDCFWGLEATAPNVDFNQLSYAVAFRYASTQLSLGASVVLDSPLARWLLYDEAVALGRKWGAATVLVDCICGSEDEWRRRIEQRAETVLPVREESGHKPKSWHEIQRLLERYQGCWRWSMDGSTFVEHHIVLDITSMGRDAAVAHVLDSLAAMNLVDMNTRSGSRGEEPLGASAASGSSGVST